jgi:hypothetical protein
MRFKVGIKIFICGMVAFAASCSVYNDYQASRPENVTKVEARLDQAGFRKVSIETPAQDGAVAQLPLHQLNRYDSAKGSVFWYADPTVCRCLYQGDLQAYMRYTGILQQENDTAEYVNDTQPEQVAYLGSFGETFPRPLIFGPAGPIFVIPPPGGAFHHPGGGLGGGIRGIGGGGGGFFHGGGHGGGHR